MNKICIYTSIYGNRSTLKWSEYHPSDLNIDYICFTDESKDKIGIGKWNIIVNKPTNKDPCRSAKIYKILPHKYLCKYDLSLWIDGSFIFHKCYFDELLNAMGKSNILFMKHHQRDCLYDEANACIKLKKDNEQIIKKQIEIYKYNNFPKNNGLFWCGIIMRKHNKKDIIKFDKMWMNEINRFSKRDQISCPYCVNKLNLKYSIMDVEQYKFLFSRTTR